MNTITHFTIGFLFVLLISPLLLLILCVAMLAIVIGLAYAAGKYICGNL